MVPLYFQSLARWQGELINGVRYGRDIDNWPDADLAAIGLYKAKPPDEIPEGKQPGAGVEWDGSSVRYALEEIPPPPRRMVAKSVVTQRVIDAGKIDQAMAMLQMDWAKFARWVAPDQPAVYFDDPDAIAMIEALELDPEVIMAPE